MKKSIKTSVFLILIFVMAISVFGCAKKTPGKTVNPSKQTEQKKPDEEQKKPNEGEKKPGDEENKPSIKNKVKIKFTIKGQKTFGDEYEQAEGTESEYVSSIEKEERDTVKPSELLSFVKEKINETIYNKEQMSYKHDGEAISETQPVQVKSPNTVIEFYVNRQIRTITLDTTHAVNTSKLKGAVEITNENKILKFRHGYSFVGDETPTISETENEEFNGWLKDSNIYKFDNTNSVTADATLIPNMRKRDAIVNINLNGLSGANLRYEADGITARPDGSNTKITFNVPYSKMSYTLKNLRADSVFTVGSSKVEQTGYSGEVNINKAGKTYNLTVTYRELGATVNIGGLEGNGWYYSDAGIDAVQSGNKITLNVPSERLPYTLKPLQNTGLPFSSLTQKAIKYVGYQDNELITTGGNTYERTAQFSEDVEKYKGLYPQTKAESSEIEGTTITEEVANNEPKAGYGKFSYTLAYNKGNKFEVINGEYYKFEPVEWEEFPPEIETNKQWTKNTLDVSVFDNGQANSNIYSGSYIEGYLRIMAQKMQIDHTLSLPKLGGNDALPWNTALTYCNQNTAAEIKEKLKYKKVTDYARAVSGNYKTLRNITIHFYGNTAETTWLGTRHQDANKYSYSIDYYGTLASEYTYTVQGLRVAK